MTRTRSASKGTGQLSASSPDTLFVIDGHGMIERVGGNVERMLGGTRRNLRGMSILELLDADSGERLMSKLGVFVAGGPGNPAVVLEGMTARGLNGSEFPAELVLVVFDTGPEPDGSVLITLRDDTRAAVQRGVDRRARERLEASNRDLEAFAAIAAHDLQEPLRKILAFSDRLRSAIVSGELDRADRYIERVEASAERMQTLIDDLLMLARINGQEPNLERIDVREVILAVVDELEQLGGDKMTIEIGAIPDVEADPVRFRQLFHNLIGNALKYRRPDEPSVVHITGTETDGWVRIEVRDNGIGFDNRYLDRIFEPFERLHGRDQYEGTGVGLAMCRAIVERHGGAIEASGEPGHGATFTVVLAAPDRGPR